jgi:putative protein-disulfide isomerase
VQRATGVRGHDLAGCPKQQRHAQLSLEPSHLLTHHGLADAEAFRSASKGPCINHRREVGEAVQIYRIARGTSHCLLLAYEVSRFLALCERSRKLKFFSMHTPALTLLYDPLCGWCYGAAPAVRRLAEHGTPAIELLPSGLFAGEGARPLDESFAQHAWSHDQRIAQLTGQPFSEAYRQRVLADRQLRLDSGPANVALTAVWQVAPARELDALEAIQKARYVEGRDTTSYAVLADVLCDRGLQSAAHCITWQTRTLQDAAAARMDAGKALLQSVGARGVPTLVIHGGSGPRVVPSNLLYGPADTLLLHLRSFLFRATQPT